MMSGKGARPTFRRTTSMTGISFDVATSEATPPPPPPPSYPQNPMDGSEFMEVEGLQGRVSEYDHLSTAMILSPRYYNRISSTFDSNTETAPFLRTCGLCNRRLAPGRDIYMYRGDKAFCSQECREQQMKQDERKERRSMAVPSDGESHNHRTEVGAAAAETTEKIKTVAAA
ncbi:Hypothetical predicted protein [Olea europaea subsp. europaea]|uniref:FLZ-type domain-containing protein n=1 Tax=Olea europaea subsp. europaea TaxID=158383 RepID=A0A8S0SLZ5_OLEEU|nr:Hypothetical predicted protein [Olea europaea subsp. europaea]